MKYIPIIAELVPSPSSWSVVENLKDIIEQLFDLLDIEFSAGGVTFTLFDVLCAGGLFAIAGSVIGYVFFWTLKRR